MATKGDHQASLHSSIALLQERFRQLQKIREMRQERELLHVSSVSESESERHFSNTTTLPTIHNYPYQPSTLFFDSDLIFKQKPSSQLALSLWPDSQIKHANLGGPEIGTTTTTAKSWLGGTTLGHNSAAVFQFDDSISDIDTSLHL